VSLWIVLRLGYAARVAFLAHFDRDTLIRALAFGAPVTVAGVMGALGWSVQLWLLEHYLVNYTEALANWNIAYGLIIAYGTLGALYGAVMPATSEGFSHQRLELTRYYIAQSFKYGGWFSAFVASAFLAMADRFILGSLGSEWARAAHLVSILTIWGAVQYPAWIADNLQQGVGKPYLQALLLIMEQSIRIIMMFIFLERFQLTGMVLAYLIALPTKDVVAWIVNWKVITPFRIYWWQSVVAPLLAGAVTYAMVRVVGGIIWRADLVTSLLVFFIGTIPSVPWFSFWSGVFGGWDDATLDELRRAALMTPFEGMAVGLARFLHRPRPGTLERVLINPAYLIYWACALGARWSPLHNRFPLHRAAAIREAQSLTLEKVALA
jgi:O-antigen/teichoic acid export membrane protein